MEEKTSQTTCLGHHISERYRASVVGEVTAQSPKDTQRQHPPDTACSLCCRQTRDPEVSSTATLSRLQSWFLPQRLLNTSITVRPDTWEQGFK